MNKRIVIFVFAVFSSLACVTSAVFVPLAETAYPTATEPTLEVAQQPTLLKAPVCASAWTAVHLRAGQGSDEQASDTVMRGAKVTIRSRAGAWWLVEFNGRVGYVRAKYLRETECE